MARCHCFHEISIPTSPYITRIYIDISLRRTLGGSRVRPVYLGLKITIFQPPEHWQLTAARRYDLNKGAELQVDSILPYDGLGFMLAARQLLAHS